MISENLLSLSSLVLNSANIDGQLDSAKVQEIYWQSLCKDNVLKGLCHKGYNLRYVSKDLKRDKEVVKCAVLNDGFALAFASDEIKDDLDIVKIAVLNNGYSLRFASKRLRGNIDLVLDALVTFDNAFRFASEELRMNKIYVLSAVSVSVNSLSFASGGLTQGGLINYIKQLLELKKCFMFFLLACSNTNTDISPYASGFKQRRAIHRPISLLNKHGKYHASKFKILISEYLGASIGRNWIELKKAIVNLNICEK